MKQPPFRPLASVLTDTDGLAPLRDALAARADLTAAVRAALPEMLAVRCAAASLDGGRLTIACLSAADATVLRFAFPALTREISRHLGRPVHTIKASVVPAQAPPPTPPRHQPCRSSSGAEALHQTAQAQRGHPELAAALERLSRRLREP